MQIVAAKRAPIDETRVVEGRRIPIMGSGAGTVLLSTHPDEEARRILIDAKRRHLMTLPEIGVDSAMSAINQVRRRGYFFRRYSSQQVFWQFASGASRGKGSAGPGDGTWVISAALPGRFCGTTLVLSVGAPGEPTQAEIVECAREVKRIIAAYSAGVVH
jgi:hypothetical protein